jgi:hypothetical protein
MPVQLPIAPKGPTPLPAAPHDPPTHTDIANAITYNRRIQVSYSMSYIFY